MNIPLFPAKIAASALGSFGVLALVLAAVGIYGVMSHMVAGRTREIGLRMALGAQSRSVGLLILKQGMTLALIGSVIGLALAFGGTRLLQSILYGVSAVDPVTFATVAFLLGTRRAARLLVTRASRRARRSDDRIAERIEAHALSSRAQRGTSQITLGVVREVPRCARDDQLFGRSLLLRVILYHVARSNCLTNTDSRSLRDKRSMIRRTN